MAVQTNGNAPYAPASAILDIINTYRNRGLQTPFNLGTLTRAGVTDSLAPRTLQAFKILDLLDEGGNPTEAFERLRLASGEEFQERLAEVVHAGYAEVFQFVDPSQDSPDRIEDAFRGFTPPGQRSRMVTLFLGMCEAAGIIETTPRRPRSEGNGEVRRRPQRSSRTTRSDGHRRPASGRNKASTNVGDVPPAIAGLLASLPAQGAGWSEDQRKGFLQAFSAVLDFAYPIVRPDRQVEAEDEED